MSYKPAPTGSITLWTIKRDLINQYVIPSLDSMDLCFGLALGRRQSLLNGNVQYRVIGFPK
jgi:hypothetical protein